MTLAMADRVATPAPPLMEPPPMSRLAIDPDQVEQDLSRLVLTLVEFLRRLMEGQAARRLEAETITAEEAERLGLTLLRAREAVVSLCARLGVAPDSLNLDLGPLGRLM